MPNYVVPLKQVDSCVNKLSQNSAAQECLQLCNFNTKLCNKHRAQLSKDRTCLTPHNIHNTEILYYFHDMQNHTIILVFSQIICAVFTGMPAALQTCIPAINSYIEPFNGFKSIKKQQEN